MAILLAQFHQSQSNRSPEDLKDKCGDIEMIMRSKASGTMNKQWSYLKPTLFCFIACPAWIVFYSLLAGIVFALDAGVPLSQPTQALLPSVHNYLLAGMVPCYLFYIFWMGVAAAGNGHTKIKLFKAIVEDW